MNTIYLMNTISITARVTADPTTRTAAELQICDLRVAIARARAATVRIAARSSWTSPPSGRWPTSAASTWPRVAAWWSPVAWSSTSGPAEDGSPRRRHKIIADQVEFLDNGAPNGNANSAAAEAPSEHEAQFASSEQTA